mmetsp:Transcript_31712/g.91343  ORF Transcript_31712/g.91343 Transcript_31712/m.91343 type:complete len:289 (-) Transcript_31712:35-901(-)
MEERNSADDSAEKERHGKKRIVNALRSSKLEPHQPSEEEHHAHARTQVAHRVEESVLAVFRVAHLLEDPLGLSQLPQPCRIIISQLRSPQDLLHGDSLEAPLAVPRDGDVVGEDMHQVLGHLLKERPHVDAAMPGIRLANQNNVPAGLDGHAQFLLAPRRLQHPCRDEEDERLARAHAAGDRFSQAVVHINVQVDEDAQSRMSLFQQQLHSDYGVLRIPLQVREEHVIPLGALRSGRRVRGGLVGHHAPLALPRRVEQDDVRQVADRRLHPRRIGAVDVVGGRRAAHR